MGAATAGYWVLVASKHVSTSNAYVGANVADVPPRVGGPVKEVLVDDARVVKRGQLLVSLDDTDTQIALAKAQADLTDTERRVLGLIATDAGLSAQIAARIADQSRASAQLAAAKGDLEKARIDLSRRRNLAESGSVSGEELTTAKNAFTTVTANLKAAEAALALAKANRASAVGTQQANNALIQNTRVDTNPEVLAARAVRDQARVNLDRTLIRAPVDGVISCRNVQIGQRVQAGETLMTVVPIATAYVDANFKEGLL